MAKSWNRVETWVTLLVLGAGGLVLGLAGLWIYVSATATPLHPEAAGVPSVAAADPTARWTAAVERSRQVMREGLAGQNLPGVTVAVGVDGAIVWAEGFGWANIERKTAVTPDTRFRIGTASIPLTSAAVGLLVERGRLRLDDEIQAYVPEFPKKAWPVTVRQLMAHTAGVRNDGGDEGPLFGQHCARPVEALPAFADRDLLFEPGTAYRYSSFGWVVVSAAVEAAAGEPFFTFMQRHVFGPLGMDGTAADTTVTASAEGRATSYFPRFAADPRYGPDVMREAGFSCYAGASAFESTASDLVRFGLAVLNGLVLQPATVQLLHSPQRLTSGQETGYGLGWDLEVVTLAGIATVSVGHDGHLLGGRAASLLTFPERDLVVSVIANTSYADTATLALQIADAFAATQGAAGQP
jgi:serine beta-lactamase-like protein LACTB, mitochondrial